MNHFIVFQDMPEVELKERILASKGHGNPKFLTAETTKMSMYFCQYRLYSRVTPIKLNDSVLTSTMSVITTG